jgi:hypothetical protein
VASLTLDPLKQCINCDLFVYSHITEHWMGPCCSAANLSPSQALIVNDDDSDRPGSTSEMGMCNVDLQN